LLGGLVYLVSPKFMPYHETAIGIGWDSLTFVYQVLILAFMKAVGAGSLGLGLTLLILLFIPFKRGEPWANWVIPLIGLIWHIPTLYAVLMVKFNTPSSPPWQVIAIGIILQMAGLVLTVSAASKAEAR
jgi:hypothetical protein